MNNTDKHLKLILFLLGGFISFIVSMVVIFYLLKLCSVTLFYIPGFDKLYQFVVTIVPYVIFFMGYYYMHKKILLSKSKGAAIAARTLFFIGSILCLCTMILSTLALFGVQKGFLLTYQDNSQYGWILQVVILFFTALIIASGDGKEEGWMHKHTITEIPEEPQV